MTGRQRREIWRGTSGRDRANGCGVARLSGRRHRPSGGELPRAARDCRRSRSMKPTARPRTAGRTTGRTGTQGAATGRRHRPSGGEIGTGRTAANVDGTGRTVAVLPGYPTDGTHQRRHVWPRSGQAARLRTFTGAEIRPRRRDRRQVAQGGERQADGCAR